MGSSTFSQDVDDPQPVTFFFIDQNHHQIVIKLKRHLPPHLKKLGCLEQGRCLYFWIEYLLLVRFHESPDWIFLAIPWNKKFELRSSPDLNYTLCIKSSHLFVLLCFQSILCLLNRVRMHTMHRKPKWMHSLPDQERSQNLLILSYPV